MEYVDVIRDKINKLKQSEIVQSIATLSIGSTISQLIPVLISVVLSRLYSPNQFGEWGVFSSYTVILSVLVCARYEYAILRPKNNTDAINVAFLAFVICFLVSSVLFLIILFGKIFDISFITNIRGFYILPIYVFLSGVIQILSSYHNREENYKQIAFSSVIRSISQAISRVVLGIFKSGYGLIVGALLGLIGGFLPLVRKIKIKEIFFSISLKTMKEQAHIYKKFPTFELPSSLFNAFSTNIPLILLSTFYDKEYVGYFTMALTLLYMPMTFIGNAMGQIFYKKSCVCSPSEISDLAISLFKFTIPIGIIIVIICSTFGELLFSIFLGSNWSEVGVYSSIMSIWIFLVFCLSPIGSIFMTKDKQRISLFLNILLFILRILAIVLGAMLFNSIRITVLFYALAGIIVWSIQGIYMMKILDIPRIKINNIYLCFIVLSAIWFILQIRYY